MELLLCIHLFAMPLATVSQSTVTWEMVSIIGMLLMFFLVLFALLIWGVTRSE